MTSLAIHAALGVLTVVIFFRVNRYLYTHGWQGSRVTWLEGLYYLLGVGSVCIGWLIGDNYFCRSTTITFAGWRRPDGACEGPPLGRGGWSRARRSGC